MIGKGKILIIFSIQIDFSFGIGIVHYGYEGCLLIQNF